MGLIVPAFFGLAYVAAAFFLVYWAVRLAIRHERNRQR